MLDRARVVIDLPRRVPVRASNVVRRLFHRFGLDLGIVGDQPPLKDPAGLSWPQFAVARNECCPHLLGGWRLLAHRSCSSARSRAAHRANQSAARSYRSEEHTSELQSRENLVCRLLLEKKNRKTS